MSKFEIECGIVIYKCMSLSIMQLLSVLFKCKIYYLSLSIMQLLSVLLKCKIYYLFNFYLRIF